MDAKQLNLLIATDLDGTLLDHNNYSFTDAQPALQLINNYKIPLIINTSKTCSEVVLIRQELDNKHPFIVENGSGVLLPIDYFPELDTQSMCIQDNLILKTFGTTLNQILAILTDLKTKYGFQFKGFSDMSVDELSNRTGLNRQQAEQAKDRLFSEPIVWMDNDKHWKIFYQQLQTMGLQILRGGRFLHISGGGNKGSALDWLKNSYSAYWRQTPVLIAAGDSQNDMAMLEIADHAVVVRSPVNPPLSLNKHRNVSTTQECGPKGWNVTMLNLISQQLALTYPGIDIK